MDSFMNEGKSDVIFIVDNERIPAVKSYLAQKSYVFQRMFSNRSNQNEVRIPELKGNAFKVMILFLYSEYNDPTFAIDGGDDYRFVIEIYRCAHKCEVWGLLEIAVRLLIRLIEFNNFLALYEFAATYHMSELKTALDIYMEKHIDQFRSLTDEDACRVN